jgi:DNA repair exonuclease SbcCD nuclease subunit
MDEITILTAGDIHISDINPHSRVDNFKETILDKLDQLKKAANKLKVDAVLLTGDLYNLKNPVKNSHDLNRELITLFKGFKCPIYTIVGNHDLTADDLDTLSFQPISVLFASGTLINLAEPIVFSKKGLKVSLVGIPYQKHFSLEKTSFPAKGDVQAQICVMHVYAGPKAGKMHKERLYGYDELATLGADVYVLGHYHYDQDIQWKNKQCFINLGSISRGTLTDERVDHQPKFGFIKIFRENEEVKIEADSIPLRIKPPEEIFDLKKREEEQKEGLEIEKYVEHLVAEASSDNKAPSIEEQMIKMNVEKTVMDLVLDLIREVRSIRK